MSTSPLAAGAGRGRGSLIVQSGDARRCVLFVMVLVSLSAVVVTLFSLDNVHTDGIGSIHRDVFTGILLHRDFTKKCANDGCNQKVSRKISQKKYIFDDLSTFFKFVDVIIRKIAPYAQS